MRQPLIVYRGFVSILPDENSARLGQFVDISRQRFYLSVYFQFEQQRRELIDRHIQCQGKLVDMHLLFFLHDSQNRVLFGQRLLIGKEQFRLYGCYRFLHVPAKSGDQVGGRSNQSGFVLSDQVVAAFGMAVADTPRTAVNVPAILEGDICRH